MTPDLALAPATSTPGLAGRVGDALAVPRRVPALLLVSAAISMACCLLLFDPGFLDGSAPFWRDPYGTIPGSWADMATALSGYDYFVRDEWRLPLFQVARLGAPGGTNVIYTDSTPVLALAGRLLFRLTGRAPNPFGLWTALCLVASAASMTLLAVRLGARSLAAALAATAFGLCAPALLARWGHTTLMAQFEVTLSLAGYFGAARASPALPRLLWTAPLCALALWTHAYLFAMVAAVAAAAIAQAVLDRRLRPAQGLGLAAGLAALLGAQLVLSGYLAAAGALSAIGFGLTSANLLSPFVPDRDVLAILLGLPRPDATGYQYEGYCYLGLGALLLLWCARRPLAGQARGAVARHPCLLAALLACSLFSLSDEVFLGTLHVLHVPLPPAAVTLAGVFRASGRFAWPATYLAMALGIAGCAAFRHGRRATAILLAAAVLQCADTAPLWADLERSLHAPLDFPADASAWETAIARHRFVRVAPAYGCLGQVPPPLGRVLMQIQLIAGRLNVATNSLFSARPDGNCPPSVDTLEPGELLVLWLGDPAQPRPGPASPCATAHDLAVCSTTLDGPGLAALLPHAPLAPGARPS